MKIDSNISATLASLQPNNIGLLAWSLLANPAGWQAGGVPGQPDPDFPGPGQGEQPSEPGEPTIPDVPPPTPMA
ncbi:MULTISPECIES: hypothetical protein [Pseudomonas]|uniref:Uncharacterized protein n=1 Tax=Pseudomonas quercus TaxID=2722792 RepID=A0ABX0YDI8_9PSED|nr:MULTISPECIES: hypothetical protein [Pseudomonas]MBF7141589.1 hypothetical protein [Pseudomonas sp. LY10J]NJP00128.1 hypothetical protein [Pseudomonas quercus]